MYFVQRGQALASYLLQAIVLLVVTAMGVHPVFADIGAELITTPSLVGFTTSDDQFVAADSDNLGRVVAVWASAGKVYWSRKGGGGSSWTTPAAFATSSIDSAPAIATDRNGNWVVVWVAQPDSQVPSNRDLWFSRSVNNGSSWSTPKVLHPELIGHGRERNPAIATDNAGHWIIVFSSDHSYVGGDFTGLDFDIFASRSSDAGATWDEPTYVNPYARQDNPPYGDVDGNPSIATNGNGDWLVAWDTQHGGSAPSVFCGSNLADRMIFTARSSTNGQYWSMYRCPPIVNNGLAFSPDVTTDPQGFVVVWQQETDSNDYDIYASYREFYIYEWSDSVPVNSDHAASTDPNWVPRVSADPHGNVIAVWERRATSFGTTNKGDLYIARSTNGAQSWSDLELLTFDALSPNADDRRPALVFHPGDTTSLWSVFFESRVRDFAESAIYRSQVFISLSPENDDWEDAIELPETGPSEFGTLEFSTNDGSATCGDSADRPDVWYSHTAFVDGTLRVFTCESHDNWDTDTVVSMHTPPGPGTEANEIPGSCNDDWDGVSPFPDGCPYGFDDPPVRDSISKAQVTAGEEVLIRVSSHPNSQGELFNLTLRLEPANNDCADAKPVGVGTVTGTHAGTGTDGADSCVSTSGADTWYRFTAPEDGVLHVTTCGTHDLIYGVDQGIDTVLSLHSVCPAVNPPPANDLVCNDNFPTSSSPAACQFTDFGTAADSALDRAMSGGEQVLIRVAEEGSLPAGHYYLNIQFEPACVPSAEVCDGQDNDCDDLVDEGIADIVTGTDTGECQVEIQRCTSGSFQVIQPGIGPVAESCDGLDNDCDGPADEGLGTTTCGLGICLHTVNNCQGGVPQVCDPLAGATAEVCDGLDNDCDGSADEGLSTDVDGDGHYAPGSCLAPADDCDDNNQAIWDCNTPVGPGPHEFEDPTETAKVTLPEVTSGGDTTVSVGECDTPPEGIVLTQQGICITVETTATFDGQAEVCVEYDDSGLLPGQEQALRLVNASVTPPELLEPSPNTDYQANILCGYTDQFSVIALGIPMPVLDDINFDACIPELHTSAVSVTAHDPAEGALTYDWQVLNGGTLTGSGSDVVFAPGDTPSHPCPYQIKVTVTSAATSLSAEENIDIHVTLAGDFNGEGDVDGTDLAVFAADFGRTDCIPSDPCEGDLDTDGDVDGSDLAVFAQRFGRTDGCGCP
jgi:hypothetical protein